MKLPEKLVETAGYALRGAYLGAFTLAGATGGGIGGYRSGEHFHLMMQRDLRTLCLEPLK